MLWKQNEHKMPALAILARDRVERLFNSARDVFHYRWVSLKPRTIQELMMYVVISKCEIADMKTGYYYMGISPAKRYSLRARNRIIR